MEEVSEDISESGGQKYLLIIYFTLNSVVSSQNLVP